MPIKSKISESLSPTVPITSTHQILFSDFKGTPEPVCALHPPLSCSQPPPDPVNLLGGLPLTPDDSSGLHNSILNKHQSELLTEYFQMSVCPHLLRGSASVSRGPLFCHGYDYDIVKSTELEEKVSNKITRSKYI